MIPIRTCIIAGSCTGTGSAWEAVAVVDGVPFAARSRHGSTAALARQLIDGGVPADQPVRITFDGLAGHMTFRSLGALAGWTWTEGAGPLRRVPWQPRDFDRPSVGGEAGDTGEDVAATPGPGAGNDASAAPPVSVTTCAGCGEPLTTRAGAKTCSPACRKRLSRAAL
jgi:hypothetical protein